ncbi:hypothetical protein ACLKA6_015908 [Drosophila palustris]
MNTFVANRVADIQESTPEVDWRHVPTKENPADLVSRGCTIDELNASFWFKGPDFLAKGSNEWPKNPHFSLSPDNSRLEKRKVATVFTAAEVSPNPIVELVESCSSYCKILRIVAYILRFVWCITNRKRSSEFSSLVVGVQELESAFLTVVSIVQQDKYCDEIKKIQKSIALQPSLQKLTPFVDTYLDKNRKMTLLRVGGRLLNAPLSHQAKFPLIMPKGCRFLARRGPVIRLHCDNATNFVGAARELKEFASHFIKHGNAMVDHAAQRGTEFAFIPPRAPHFGGLWEAAVKAAKHHLLRAIGGVILATDELQTVVVEVEAVLNSRPIVADSTNPNDVEAITPSHLLVGRTLATLPPASVHLEDDSKLCYLRRWRLVSAVKERFWASWSRDYLLGLQQKHRWTREEQNLEVDAVVLIHEDNVPSQNWLLGVVTDVVKGADGKVRVAVVRTKSGVYKRAIHRLAPLPKA